MLRRLAPWAASAAIHAAVGVAAILVAAHISSVPAPDPDATYAITIRPGGGPRIAEPPRVDSFSYGVPQDTFTIEEVPLTGVPDLPVTSNAQAPITSKTGRGETSNGFRHGPVVKFSGGGEGGQPQATTSGSGRGVGEGRDDGVEAVPVETPPPVYPDQARRKNLQGAVIAEIQIDTQGKVASARTAEGSGSALLDDAALAAVKAWKYKPATLNGKAVPCVRRVRFVFRLE